jgi:hypothetical protein
MLFSHWILPDCLLSILFFFPDADKNKNIDKLVLYCVEGVNKKLKNKR